MTFMPLLVAAMVVATLLAIVGIHALVYKLCYEHTSFISAGWSYVIACCADILFVGLVLSLVSPLFK